MKKKGFTRIWNHSVSITKKKIRTVGPIIKSTANKLWRMNARGEISLRLGEQIWNSLPVARRSTKV